MKTENYKGKSLSRYRTENVVENLLRVRCAGDASEFAKHLKTKKIPFFILGGGSNVFFKNKIVKSFLLKNEIPEDIKILDEKAGLFEVSSGTSMQKLLKFLYDIGRDAPYYLASAPCQVGGAIAMNAGAGPLENLSISDFIASVKFIDSNGNEVELEKSSLDFSHRKSFFSKGEKENFAFIISAKFYFPKKTFEENPIEKRLKWAAENQDLTAPNCGSLCNKYYAPILKFARVFFAPLPAGISKKKLNWAYNKANNPIYLRTVLLFLKIAHKLMNKELKFEIKIVD